MTMTPREFQFWLEGFAANIPEAPNPEQWQAIRDRFVHMMNTNQNPRDADVPPTPFQGTVPDPLPQFMDSRQAHPYPNVGEDYQAYSAPHPERQRPAPDWGQR